jgi:adenosylhomocysteine nucleosidase
MPLKIAVIISAFAEWSGVRSLFPDEKIRRFPYGECFDASLGRWPVTFFHAGWGKIASAGAIQYIIDHHKPDLIVNLGTCGGFEGVVNQGDVILVEKTFVYDIVELMGDPDISSFYASSLDLSWLASPEPHPVWRSTLASADSDLLPEKIPFLKAKGAIAADWESGALAWVAKKNNVRLLILRAVSDIVNDNSGEAYNNIELFNERSRVIMKLLVNQLPGWLDAVSI